MLGGRAGVGARRRPSPSNTDASSSALESKCVLRSCLENVSLVQKEKHKLHYYEQKMRKDLHYYRKKSV